MYFNFKVFNFKDAIHLPVFLYGNISIENIYKGCVILQKTHMGTVKLGGGWHTELFGYAKLHNSFIRIEGKLVCGSNVTLCQGCVLSISKGGIISLGNNVKANINCKIHAKENITIEDNCRIGWESQIFDTNFHYTISDGTISYRNAPVYIGHNCWLANRVSVIKGAKLPPYSVVASMSIINKDMMQYGDKCLFGGSPAKLIRTHTERILNHDEELDNYFSEEKVTIPLELVKDVLT